MGWKPERLAMAHSHLHDALGEITSFAVEHRERVDENIAQCAALIKRAYDLIDSDHYTERNALPESEVSA